MTPHARTRPAPVPAAGLQRLHDLREWYGHLKYKSAPLVVAILASWGIAFFEYSLMVPANRIGSAVYSVVQLKTIQEILTLLVFAGFSTWYLGQPLKWNHYAAFALIVGAAFLMFYE